MQISASKAFVKIFFTLFRSFREYFRHAEENYFRHAVKLHTSQQRQPHTKHTNSTRTRAILIWPHPAGPSARTALRPVLTTKLKLTFVLHH